MKQSKVWGDTSLLWIGNNAEVHIINAVNGGFCSKHKHEHKSNMFYVESGKLLIEVWKENGLIDKTILTDGESTVVDPCIYHRFTALEDTKAIEIYWVELNKNDIMREDHGGIKDK